MKHIQLGLAALVLATLAGCGNTELDDARDNLALWRAKGPSSYVYVVERQCFCPRTGPVRVVVEDGVVTSPEPTKAQSEQTMTALLEGAVRVADSDWTRFEASYDSALGYLKDLEVDRSDAEDDSFSTHVSCLGEGTDDDVCPRAE